MIAFFRKLRQRLLAESQLSKYLLYALGEILLVVIGILLALQVNTWDNDREARLEEHALLLRLENELKQDLKEIGEVKDDAEIRILLALPVLDSLGKNNGQYVRGWRYYVQAEKTFAGLSGMKRLSLGQSLFYVLARNQFNPARITFDEMQSTGKLSLLRSDALRIALQQHYSDLNGLQMFEDGLMSEVQKSFRDALYSNEISTLSHENQPEILERMTTPGQLMATLENYLKVTMTFLEQLYYNSDSTYQQTLELLTLVQEQIAASL
ncbi:MAG TPA: DUF6090 family protein [Robiginitalea sp.]|nr:DUF6090 family protein [Robiginitalea sp.]